jgi:hypothetical protein
MRYDWKNNITSDKSNKWIKITQRIDDVID